MHIVNLLRPEMCPSTTSSGPRGRERAVNSSTIPLAPGPFQEANHEKNDKKDDSRLENERKKRTGNVHQYAKKAETDEGNHAVDEPTKDCSEVEIHDRMGGNEKGKDREPYEHYGHFPRECYNEY